MNKLKPSALRIQCLAAFILSSIAMLAGFITAWPSQTIELFKSNETVLNRPMTSIDISWLGCLLNLGGFIGSPIFGYASNKFGRKYSIILSGLPFVISWAMITVTKSIPIVLLAVTIAGVGIAGQRLTIIFMSEISHESIRGALTACFTTGYLMAMLISHLLGGYLGYYQMLFFNLTISVLSVMSLPLLKESPMYLVLIGKEEEAVKSIAFYNQVDVNSKLVERELKKIKLQLKPQKALEEEKDVEVIADLIRNDNFEKNDEPEWRFFLRSKSSQRALVTTLIIIAIGTFMGNNVLQVYTEPLFAEAVPSMSSNLCAVILAADFTLASIVCVLIIDKYGRKILLIASAVNSGICCLLLGAQLHFSWAPHWVTALLIYLYSFGYTLGWATVPFVLIADVFLPEVRNFCGSIAFAFAWVVNFISLFTFFPIMEVFGVTMLFYIFSFISFLGAIFTKLRLPETKGQTVNAIQDLFLKM